MGRKRRHTLVESLPERPSKRRDFSEQDKVLAKIYDNLADEVNVVRIQAAKSLLQQLQPPTSSAEDIQKALGRLIRGLCSGRKAARAGFFTALTELLRHIYVDPGIASFPLTIKDIIKLGTELTQPEGKVSGQEKRDYILGRVAGCSAIIESSILVRPRIAVKEWTKVLDLLCKIARDKDWIREACLKVLYDTACTLAADENSSKIGALILESLDKHNRINCPEAIAIWLALQDRTNMAWTDYPGSAWYGRDPLHRKNWSTLAKIAKYNSADGTVKGGSSQPKASFAWDVVIMAYLKRLETGDKMPPSRSPARTDFSEFCIKLIDDNLFGDATTTERKSWGFQIVSHIIPKVPDWALEYILGRNFMQTLLNQRADTERLLHVAAERPLEAIKSRVKADPSTAPFFLQRLLFEWESPNFDQRTKSRIVEDIISLTSEDSLITVSEMFFKRLSRPDLQVNIEFVETYRQHVADKFVALIRNHTNYLTEQNQLQGWVMFVLATLARAAFLSPRDDANEEDIPEPPFTDATRVMIKTRLNGCMNKIMTSNPTAMNLCALTDVEPKGIEKSPLCFEVDSDLEDDLREAFGNLKQIRKESARSKGQRREVLQSFELLLSLTIKQVLEREEEAPSLLSDLRQCWSKLSKNEGGDNSQEFLLLVEVLLGYLSKQSALLRKISETVFESLAPHLHEECLQSLIEILEKPESLAGQQQLFDDNADGLGNQESSPDSSDMSDVEVVDGPEDLGEAAAEDAEVDGSSVNDSDLSDVEMGDDGVDEEELLKLDAVLAKTLGTMMPGEQADADSESDDEDMDDDQMMALEPALAKIFKERRDATSKKQDRKEAKERMINFKNRALDLVAIYTKKEHANPLALGLILPLLDLIGSSSSQQLAEKAFKILKTYFDSCKGKDLPVPTDMEAAWALLEGIHDSAGRYPAKMYGSACSRASLFVAKVLVALDEDNYDRVADIYGNTQKQWHRSKDSKVQTAMFIEWISWSSNTRR
ncbi:hypothetical protein NA57DRAFT_33871 [Rhizodiscina lignyota]|uniref:DNA polymerase V n=1 Tax=Rhizodiscina lignyota TaxID=1504668 RepID=A0A9P4IIR2_9PEZI|nr:hypothetical protein NA57DRAFT_33871 [Rhizodiscina lignyota]